MCVDLRPVFGGGGAQTPEARTLVNSGSELAKRADMDNSGLAASPRNATGDVPTPGTSQSAQVRDQIAAAAVAPASTSQSALPSNAGVTPVELPRDGAAKTPGETGSNKLFQDRGSGIYDNTQLASFGERYYRTKKKDANERAMFGGYGSGAKLGSAAA